ncbi:hypothetical protein ONZ51_g11421 [Trametes cubensis]|uniref:Uncharacterized protein n=1 Tax=Trametes cubensis TaxID=1111947 RepID=A0AAD7TK67_9APHY|nr:hypothetical protein ONZ51_g11421 [Trametes cubensis]
MLQGLLRSAPACDVLLPILDVFSPFLGACDPNSVPAAHKAPLRELPPEIIIQIFEATARASRDGAHAISLVCQWARDLALPHLFATVVHRSRPSFSVTLSSGQRRPSQSRPAPGSLKQGHLVRNLWTESTGVAQPSAEEDIIRVCPNVENIALMSSSLRTLSQALQARAAASRKEGRAPDDAFLHRLRSITLVTHTFRYDWHFLVGAQLHDGSQLLHNITHLRVLNMKVSSFCPHNLLPNLTHLALPYLDLGNNFEQDVLRLPNGVLEHRSLQMIVLTVEEEKWLTNPWYQIARYPGKNTASPREAFCTLARWAQQRDERLYVVLSPRTGVDPCQEWVDAARGGISLWDAAAEVRANDTHGAGLPASYPKTTRR